MASPPTTAIHSSTDAAEQLISVTLTTGYTSEGSCTVEHIDTYSPKEGWMSEIIERREREVLKKLRKGQKKTLHDLAEEIGYGTTIKHLTLPISNLVRDQKAVKHTGRVPSYTKA
jgi:hypothetical protein